MWVEMTMKNPAEKPEGKCHDLKTNRTASIPMAAVFFSITPYIKGKQHKAITETLPTIISTGTGICSRQNRGGFKWNMTWSSRLLVMKFSSSIYTAMKQIICGGAKSKNRKGQKMRNEYRIL